MSSAHWAKENPIFLALVQQAVATDPRYAMLLDAALAREGIAPPPLATTSSTLNPSFARLHGNLVHPHVLHSTKPRLIKPRVHKPRTHKPASRKPSTHRPALHKPASHAGIHLLHGTGGLNFVATHFTSTLPVVTGTNLIYDTGVLPQQLTVTFNEPVGASSWSAAVPVQDVSTGTILALADSNFSFNSTTDVLTISLGTARIPDGNFTATLNGSLITDNSGNKLAGSDGIPGDPYTDSFFLLAGDTNHEGVVDITDYNTLESNFGITTGGIWSKGDFNYDRKVNSSDYFLQHKNYGENLSLPIPTAVQATGTTSSTASLSWTAITNPNVTGYDVLRNGTFLATVNSASTMTYTDTGLSPGTSNTYTIESINSASQFSPPSFPAVTAITAPTAPTSLTATANSPTQVTLNWTAATGTVTAYHVERSTDGVNFNEVANNVSGTTYTDSSALGDVTYTYRVRAEDSGSFSGYSNTSQLTTPANAATNLTGTPFSNTEIDLAWTAPPAAQDLVVQDSTNGGTTWSQVAQLAFSANAEAVTGVSPSTAYTFQVLAYNSVGQSTASATITASTYALSTPINVTATAVSTSEIDLAWSNSASGATAVELWKSSDGLTFSLLATLPTSATSYSDVSLPEATEYAYEVRATASSGTSAFTTLVPQTTLPVAPSGLTATAAGPDVNLSWVNNSRNVSGFGIYRSTDGISFTEVTTVLSGTTTYDDWAAPDGSTDYYQVRAFTDGGDSAPTATASAEPISTLRLTDDTPSTGVNYQVLHGQTLNQTTGGVLSNDIDPNGYALSVASHTNPSHGTLTLNTNGTFAYAPNNNFVGTDTFTYTATDSVSASGNTATVNIQVTDTIPEATDARLPVNQAFDSGGNPLPYAAPSSGALASAVSGILPLVYSVVTGPAGGQGSFSLDPNSGNFTFTPDHTYQGPVTIVYKVNDGALDSNISSLSSPGYTVQSNGYLLPIPAPWAGPNQHDWVYENGTASLPAPGLLTGVLDNDPAPDADQLAVDPALIVQPMHGTISSLNAADGSFIYQPTAGFVGSDLFTYRAKDGSKESGYMTFLIDVIPAPVSLSVGTLAPGDPTAAIYPGSQGAQAPAQYSILNINTPAINAGDTITISADDADAINVWDSTPGSQGSHELLGHDAGTSSYTVTIGPFLTIPRTLYVVGLTPSDYGQVVFHLAYSPGPQSNSGNSIGHLIAAPTTLPLTAQQNATVPGKSGFLEALDGTTDAPVNNTNIHKFYAAYIGTDKKYHRGVGNSVDHPLLFDQGLSIAFGDVEALTIEQTALAEVSSFYQNPAHRYIPFDLVGYSRGAMESVMLVNDLLKYGVWDTSTKTTTHVDPNKPQVALTPFFPTVRYVGLISPVMGPYEAVWPLSLPVGVGWMFQALDNFPNDPLLPQHTITRAAGTMGHNIDFPDGHSAIGSDAAVLGWMVTEGKQAGAPVQ